MLRHFSGSVLAVAPKSVGAVLDAATTTLLQRSAPARLKANPLFALHIRQSAWQSTAAAKGNHASSGIDPGRSVDASDGIPGDTTFNPAPHPSKLAKEKGTDYLMMHPVYTKEYVESVKPKHRPPKDLLDRAAYYSIQTVRASYDVVSGYGPNMTKDKWLNRVVFLETVAGVPGMVGGMIRHLHSLRLMRRDYGWIHTLLEEAENERMHLLTFLKLKQPGFFFRTLVLGAQGVFCNMFFLAYLISPSYCHRLVGYLEEEAVKTYTRLIEDLDAGKIPEWSDAPAPEIAIHYWRLHEDAKMRDLILAVRADEACHSHVNHTFAGMKHNEINPFSPGSHQVP